MSSVRIGLSKKSCSQAFKSLTSRAAFALCVLSFSLASLSSLPTSNAYAFKVQVGTAPDNTLSLILGAIGSAKRSLLINIYELASPEIAQAIIDRINHGVHVEMLQEGEPVGGVSAASRGLQAQIALAMEAHPKCCRYAEMRKGVGGARRFRYDHAKYIVIDQSALLLGSENYSPGGHPEPGTLGNRGWEVLVADTQPAQWFTKLFMVDSDPRQPDIHSLLHAGITRQATPPMPVIVPARSAVINPVLDATDGQIITSPDTSLQGILGLIQSARKTLDIEQMSFNMNWVTSSNNAPNEKGMSPIAQAIADAARRGVRVRILLNDEFAFINGGNHGGTDGSDGTGAEPDNTMNMWPSGKTTPNRRTVQAFTQLAAAERLPIEARIANLKAMGVAYIHNKGVIVDGKITLISSINWTQNSITNNRETAVALKSTQIAAFFGQAFNLDWNRSAATTSAVQAQPKTTIVEPSIATKPSLALAPVSRSAPDVCPSGLMVSATIGDIQSIDNLDPSYLELARHTLNGNFVRDLRDKRCILLGQGNFALELRKDSQGNLDADLEGYTRSFKPFSIRAEFAAGSTPMDPSKVSSAKGRVLEGSSTGGGRKRRLGLAVLSIKTP
jgi:phosphatidylserine/phosphatidylglycerophosphate/cardiolipin synthase-like enzyme